MSCRACQHIKEFERLLVVMIIAIILAALTVSATCEETTPVKPVLSFRTESLLGYLVKPGSSAPYGGLRAVLEYQAAPQLLIAGRLEAAKQTDGGAVEANFSDPSSFGSLEGEIALAGRASVKLPVYLLAAFGTTVPYDRGKAVVLNAYPRTAVLGAWLRFAPKAWIILGGGLYEPAGKGPAGILSLQLPMTDQMSLLVDAAVAKTTTLRANVAVCMIGCSK